MKQSKQLQLLKELILDIIAPSSNPDNYTDLEDGLNKEIAFLESCEEKTNAVHNEIERLASFILKEYPNEPGKGGGSGGESAVDVAIRIMSRVKHE